MDDLISRSEMTAAIKHQYCTDCNNYNGVRCRACHADDMLSLVDDAADAIPRWISVEERLPEKTGHYLTVIDCEKGVWVEVNTFDDGVRQWAHDLFHGQCIEDATPFVTNWMPLPEPPKEATP